MIKRTFRSIRSMLAAPRHHDSGRTARTDSFSSLANERVCNINLHQLILSAIFARNPHAGFIQIGAFDGTTNDPLSRTVNETAIGGVLFEPQPEYYQRLKKMYADRPQINVVNAAVVTDDASQLMMFRVSEEFKRSHKLNIADSLASSDPYHLIRYINKTRPDITDANVDVALEKLTVPAVSAADVVGHLPPGTQPSILQIDAEGMDASIARAVLQRVDEFKLVALEHKTLTTEECEDCWAMLSSLGFHLFPAGRDHGDTLAIRREFSDLLLFEKDRPE